MKDEQLFIKRFNEIGEDVGKKYQPTSWTVKVINDTLEDIIRELDDDIDVVRPKYLIKKYKNDLKKYSDSFRDAFGPHIHGTLAQKEDYKFRLEFWVKAYQFIIEYLESVRDGKPISKPKSIPKKQGNNTTALTFESMFTKKEYIEPCLDILRDLDPPFIDAKNKYIGKSKGIFALWIKVLKGHKGGSLINHLSDPKYGQILISEIDGLKLTADFSELRKPYARLDTNKIELEMKTILSQSYQKGKLGK